MSVTPTKEWRSFPILQNKCWRKWMTILIQERQSANYQQIKMVMILLAVYVIARIWIRSLWHLLVAYSLSFFLHIPIHSLSCDLHVFTLLSEHLAFHCWPDCGYLLDCEIESSGMFSHSSYSGFRRKTALKWIRMKNVETASSDLHHGLSTQNTAIFYTLHNS